LSKLQLRLAAGLCAVFAGIVHAAPAIPFKQDAASTATLLSRSAAAVLVVSLIAIAAVLFVRRRLHLSPPGAAGAGPLRVLQSQRIGPRTLLTVVEFCGTRYLVAEGEHGLTCLAQSPAPAAEGG
jgi:flagellar biogenesis protein FliO